MSILNIGYPGRRLSLLCVCCATTVTAKTMMTVRSAELDKPEVYPPEGPVKPDFQFAFAVWRGAVIATTYGFFALIADLAFWRYWQSAKMDTITPGDEDKKQNCNRRPY